jgi:hypothetical protein
VRGRCDGRPGGTLCTTADEPDQTGCHEGPAIHFDRPRAGAPALQLIRFPVWAGHAKERLIAERLAMLPFSFSGPLSPLSAAAAALLLPGSLWLELRSHYVGF